MPPHEPNAPLPEEGTEPDEAPEREAVPTRTSSSPPRRGRRVASIAFLLFGALVAVYLGSQGPQEQHVRVVLGDGAKGVTGVDLRYVNTEGDTVRSAHFSYPKGHAPRIVPHQAQLPNGEYQLEIDVDLESEEADGSPHDGRRATRRQVTLGGGSTQVDVSTALKLAPTGP